MRAARLFLLLGVIIGAASAEESPPTAPTVSPFIRNQLDQVDPGDGGVPLARPPAGGIESPGKTESLQRLCGRMKAIGKVPEYCE
jgi:hypothetical protein